MSALMEYKGDDVDQAINNACTALGVSREALDIQVVTTGSAGIFGLGRQKAAIRVGLREGDSEAAAAGPQQQAATAPPREEEAAGGEQPEEVGTGPEVAAAPMAAEEMAAIRGTVSRLLELSGCAVQAEVGQDQADGKLRIDLVGEESGRLVGPEGQTLDALQYLLRKMLAKQLGRRVILEIEAGDYRQRRRQELEERALALAAEVKSSGKSRTMAAIGPAERRIVHLALQADSEIRSCSVGEGLFKKVLIHPPGKGRKRPPRPRGRGKS